MSDSSALHTHTPTLTAIDPRGLQVRSVALHRREAGDAISERVDRSAFDSAGRLVQRWDPRLWAAANQASETSANLKTVHSLSAQVLLSDSVDAGWSVELLSEAAQRHCRWDARGHVKRVEYDSMLRPMAVFEGDGADEVCAERLTYGTTSDSFANQCGQLIRHDDPAGSLGNLSFNLTGEVIKQTRRFLIDLDLPDWPLLIEERDDLLELAKAESTWRFDPLGDVLEQTDAKGNTQSFAQTVAGQLKASNLLLRDQAAGTLISDIQYDAQGRISSEIAGNGVVTALDYDPVDGRLIRLRAGDGHLQDLNYAYDPVGNVVSIEDRAQATRHFANQRIEPLRTFAYDTLYQLIEATGYEAAAINRGPGEDWFQVFPAANELSNYTQRYEYDAGGNLQTLVHVGAQNHTRSFATSRLSNRSLLQTGDQPPSEEQITAGFDAAGNLRELQPGQVLSWDLRNQLSQVTPVKRESAANDSEVYRYDAAGMRVRKVRTSQARTVTHLGEVRYLPGLEIRSNTATGEELHVVTVTAGHSSVRVLHWQSAPPANVANDQIRYSLTDHLGSSTLELDADAQLISQEIYYPYGETAWFAGRSEVEAKYKTVRYSGKERDATGLYYYGLRYYAPWLMRWINPDPAGEADGMNLYRFVRNNPVRFEDILGMWPWDSFEKEVDTTRKKAIKAMEKVLKTLENDADGSVNEVMKRFFGSSDAELKQQWEVDIRKTLVVAKATQPINFDLSASNDATKPHVVAEVDMKQFADFRRFMTATKRASNSSTQSGDIKREQAEVRKDYKDEMETRFLKVVQPNWEKTRKNTSATFMANILIHEFSHAAVDTKDFAYGKAKEGVDPTPLFELTTDATEVSTAGSDFNQSVGMTPVRRAYKNADSFAGAIVFLARAKSRKTSERALYRLYVESQ
ncbi:MAG: RHS repeat protein [Pseudomonas sp.]|uniref:RHS repeat-associated core domain-containing protein n=1 Tax=Pseudomonas sp. TaxID=306 RepID=UPI00239B8E88|nr:RHS repeat-associated core domain-containing protein [Pseudomonas sp.]MDE1196233.1 RHS repeat protein [Pseudomonas sp.]